jgi:hypothetical protein
MACPLTEGTKPDKLNKLLKDRMVKWRLNVLHGGNS